MISMSLPECRKLLGIEGWKLTEPQKRFLMRSTAGIKAERGEEWIKKNRQRLRGELRTVFKELGPPIP